MSMIVAPRGERIHIGLFGRMNVGKSSLMNAITNQSLSIVSSEAGTTTDPVLKSMEILPLGPVVLMDTPGLDDNSILGHERIKKAQEVLKKTDLALLVLDARVGITNIDERLLEKIREEKIPYILIYHKEDLLLAEDKLKKEGTLDQNALLVSSKSNYHVEELKELMGAFIEEKKKLDDEIDALKNEQSKKVVQQANIHEEKLTRKLMEKDIKSIIVRGNQILKIEWK